MNRDGVMEQLQPLNPTATPVQLEGFSPEVLESYLTRLVRAVEPRGRQSVWRRESRDPAITKYVPSGA